MMAVNLSRYDNTWYSPGRNRVVRALWYVVNALLLQNPLNPSSGLKVFCLRLFGAKIGVGVNLKPSINVKYPWKLEIGDNSWIGENVWLDTLASVKIGKNCCVSQGVYFCTGNHDWSDQKFKLIVKPIIIEDGAWVGAQSILLPGITLGNHSILSAGCVISHNTSPYTIYAGNPAKVVRKREIQGNDNL